MSDARSSILERLAVSQLPPVRKGLPTLAAFSDEGTSPKERFAAALEHTGVTWETAENPVSARMHLVTTLQAEDVKRVLTWGAAQLPSPGLLDTLSVLGIEPTVPDLRAALPRLRPQDPDSRGDLLRSIGGVEVGIVAAEAGIADIGVLVLRGGPGRPLLAAWMPRRLRVLIASSRVFPSLSDWLAQSDPPASNPMITFLTGPSQSLDLELIRAVGIHGPREVHVVIIGGI